MERFLAEAREHGTDPRVFPRARTGGGGRHVLVAPTGAGNRAAVMPDMDWRGAGGYIVAAGSTHASGAAYEWITEPNGKFPPCPDWLLELVKRPEPQRTDIPISGDRPSNAYIEAAIAAEISELRSASIGQRNHQLNVSAFALGQMVGAGWIPESRAEAELRAAAHAIDHGREPGLTATLRSGLEDGAAQPRVYTPADRAGEIRGARVRTSVTQVDSAGNVEGEGTPATSASAVTVRSLRELRAMPEAETNWVVYRFLARTAITDLSAFIKAGKSTLSAQLIAAICHGTEFLDEFPTEQGAVVLLTEEPPATLLEAFGDAGLTDEDPLHILLWTDHDQLPWADAVAGAAQHCHDVGATTLIVDTLSQWANVEDENDASQARAAMAPLLVAASKGLAVQIVRQSRKTGGEIHNAGRGSGAFGGAASILLHLDYVRADNGRIDDSSTNRTLSIKSRLEREQAPPMALDYADGKYRLVQGPGQIINARARSTEDRLLIYLAGTKGMTSAELAERLGSKRSTVRASLTRLKMRGHVDLEDGVYRLSSAGDAVVRPAASLLQAAASDFQPELAAANLLQESDAEYESPAANLLQTAATQSSQLPTRPPLRGAVVAASDAGRPGVIAGQKCPACGERAHTAGPAGKPQRACWRCETAYTPGKPWPEPSGGDVAADGPAADDEEAEQ